MAEGVEHFGNERSRCVTLSESGEEILSTGLCQNIVALLDKQGGLPWEMKIEEIVFPASGVWKGFQVSEMAEDAVTLELVQLVCREMSRSNSG